MNSSGDNAKQMLVVDTVIQSRIKELRKRLMMLVVCTSCCCPDASPCCTPYPVGIKKVMLYRIVCELVHLFLLI